MGWTYFLACIICVSSFAAGQMPKYVLKGTWYNMKPDISGQASSISWKHNGNKVVEFNGTVQQVFGSYENRVTLDRITAELEITDLRLEDSGTYELEAAINNYIHTIKYQLEVIDKVAKPIISCKINKGSSLDESEVQAMLLCSAEKPDSLLKFEWRTQGSSTPGNKITLSLKDQKDLEKYICAVSNPLSSETATFTVKDCHHEESSSLALIIALSISILGVVGTALGILFCKFKQKACFANDEEKQAPTEESENRTSQKKPLLSEGYVNSQAHQTEQPETKNEGNKGPVPAGINNFELRPMPAAQSRTGRASALMHMTFQSQTGVSGMKPEEHKKAAFSSSPRGGADSLTDPNQPVKDSKDWRRAKSVTQWQTAGPDRSSWKRSFIFQKQESLDKTPEETKKQNKGKSGSDQKKQNKASKGPACNQTKNDEGGQDDVLNQSLQGKAPREETSMTTTDETSHLSEASSEKSAHTKKKHNKKPEITEKTAETKTEPDRSPWKRSFNFQKQESLDKTPEETKKQNKGKPGPFFFAREGLQ